MEPKLTPAQWRDNFVSAHPSIADATIVPAAHFPLLLDIWKETSSPIMFFDGEIIGPLGNAPIIVSYGMGTDSTAMLMGLYEEGIRPDAILFADVGNEMPHTYEYLAEINQWLKKVGFPQVTFVRYVPKRFKFHAYYTLAGNCLANRCLASLAYGRKSCSIKWKGVVLDRWVKENYPDQDTYRAIGYDCSAADNRRFAHANKKHADKKKAARNDLFVYPLHVWGWTRDNCDAVIEDAGLPSPMKSSCFFCPAMKKHEIADLPIDLLWQIVIIEANAQPSLRVIKGLWRRNRMTDFICEKGLLPEEGIVAAWQKWSAPDRLIVDNATVAEQVLDEEAAYFMAQYPMGDEAIVGQTAGIADVIAEYGIDTARYTSAANSNAIVIDMGNM